MSNVYNGTAINFGVAGLAMSGTGVGTFILQDNDHQMKRDLDSVRDATGAEVQHTWYNPTQEATFTYIPSGTGLANAITETTLPDIGTIVTISACTSYPALVATNWEVTDSKLKRTNTKAAAITLTLRATPGITGATGA